MTQDERQGWAAWLRRWDVDWWATPSFRYPTAPRRMIEVVTAWLAPFPGAFAAIALQRGSFGDRLHCHGVIGGTGRHPDTECQLRCSWSRGNLHLVGFSPARGAIEYLVEQATEIELLGTPVIYRPR